ncbi:MAG: tRNA (adenosine(37)-N6)-threonylcarbamoyltransferase complex dimerization subunit type 1 TsaB [Candidatus Sericytochromatia bacterium]|nr:tRNA (adenosine(37)-N6)-threonylcarbamoyltransferase complex dimerization subunit type 1 TsaB [Candidatus Sericytochromatia bacterium]
MILGIHTATPQLSLALVEDGTVLAEASQAVGNAHSEALFVQLESLFAWVGRPRTALRAVGVAMGPGGFTGVRTGMAAAKTIAQFCQLPVYGIPTLEALAAQFPSTGPVVAALDARRDLVFAGVWRTDGAQPEPIVPAGLHAVDEWLTRVQELTGEGPVWWIGEGAWCHRERIRTSHANWHVPEAIAHVAGAVSVASLAERRLAAGHPSDGPTLAPQYLREPQAVINWEARQAEAPAGGGRE